MFGRKERKMLIELAAVLIATHPEARQLWHKQLKDHELMKNDGQYLAGFRDAGGDIKEMELQISLMKEILQTVETHG